jgi:hypothetical protein
METRVGIELSHHGVADPFSMNPNPSFNWDIRIQIEIQLFDDRQ